MQSPAGLKGIPAVLNIITAANVSVVVTLGVELGLYKAMQDAGPMTSEELAKRSGCKERWVLEWLRGQAAAGIIDYEGDGRFELSEGVAAALADEDSMMYMGHQFASLPSTMNMVERLPQAFRTGLGLSWDDRDDSAVERTEMTFRNWYRHALVQTALPALDGVVARLESGAKAADVGCGAGMALVEMAKVFPKSDFHGYDISAGALARADENRRDAGTRNVAFHNVADEPMPADGSFDLISTLDCLHDMTQPDEAATAIRSAIKADGVWFIADINGAATFEENLQNPFAARFYAASVLSCLSSGLSEPGGAGLGTLGLPEPRMRELTERAGFTRFRRLDIPNPINAYYEARV